MDEETKNAAWWEMQARQFQRELDELNPKLNVAEARIRELEATLELARRDAAALATEAAAGINACEAERQRAEASLVAAVAEIENFKIALNAATESLHARVNEAVALKSEIDRLKSLCEKKDAGLQSCLAGVAEQLKTIQGAIGTE